MLSWYCSTADEVRTMKTDMTVLYDESQTARDIILFQLYEF